MAHSATGYTIPRHLAFKVLNCQVNTCKTDLSKGLMGCQIVVVVTAVVLRWWYTA